MSIDWDKIKAEYVSDRSVSYRKLADRHNVSPSMLMKIAAREKWADLRKHSVSKAEAKIVDAAANKAARKVDNITSVADMLLEEIKAGIKGHTYDMTPQAVKQLTGALKDLKEIKGIKTDADYREQEARIRKLEKEAATETTDRDIRIVIAGDAEDWTV